MALQEIRNRIDAIDDELVQLFARRMDCSREVALAKRIGKDVLNANRTVGHVGVHNTDHGVLLGGDDDLLVAHNV